MNAVWIQWGVVGALVIVIIRVLQYLSAKDKLFLGFLDNHMSAHLKALNETVESARALKEEVRLMREEVRDTVRESIRVCPGPRETDGN